MELYSWLNAISTREEFSALVALVEEGVLEELFIAQSLDVGVAGTDWTVGKPLIFSFSNLQDVKQTLEDISACVNLDSVDESYFNVIEDTYILKSVFYPESEAQEEQIIALLV
jgi:hypothetical protein